MGITYNQPHYGIGRCSTDRHFCQLALFSLQCSVCWSHHCTGLAGQLCEGDGVAQLPEEIYKWVNKLRADLIHSLFLLLQMTLENLISLRFYFLAYNLPLVEGTVNGHFPLRFQLKSWSVYQSLGSFTSNCVWNFIALGSHRLELLGK